MKFISIDIETTGINPNEDQIIEFGAIVVDDWNIVGNFRRIIWHERLSGSPFAINMNQNIINEIANYKPGNRDGVFVTINELAQSFRNYLTTNKFYDYIPGMPIKINCAGKNFSGFDNLFLNKVPDWNIFFKSRRRVLDPAILYFNPLTDEELPTLEECKERSGLFKNSKISHRADEDADDVAQLLILKLKP